MRINETPLHRFRKHECPPDGNCMFTAIGEQVGLDAATLRRLCVKLFDEQPEEEREMMALSEGATPSQYRTRLQNMMFGGHNEMILLANHFRIDVCVFSERDNVLRSVTRIRCRTRPSRRHVYLLWDQRGHYDRLERVIQTSQCENGLIY